MPLNRNDLEQFISSNGVNAQLVDLEKETLTVESAAAAVGVSPEYIGKSLLFIADEIPVLVISSGLSRISYKPIASYLGLSRRRVKLANADEVLKYTGYLVGTVPPFGHKSRLRTIIIGSVLKLDELYLGGGEENILLKIESAELQRVTAGETLFLKE